MRLKKKSTSIGILGKILNALSNSIKDTYSCDYINKQIKDVYSGEEVKTNKVWFGKPVYRTVLTGMMFDGIKNHNISNIDNITDIYGTLWNGVNQTQYINVFPINTVRVGYPDRALGVYMNKDTYSFDKGATIGVSYSYRLVVEYTKTTD